ncbi:MAG: hypothetical protein SVY53_00370 [Chloroflexota bacterium]|nr:hypothetical protein [Chloroflexota bacterium]
MDIVPIFPTLPPDIADRVRNGFEKVREKKVSEPVFVNFMATMLEGIFMEIVSSSRVKHSVERELSSLIGKKLAFYTEGLSMWVVEIVPAPKVMLLRLPADEDHNVLPGIGGQLDIMKEIFVGTASMQITTRAIGDGRLKLVNASATNPIAWARDFITSVDPVRERGDLREMAMAKAMPLIDEELHKLGC